MPDVVTKEIFKNLDFGSIRMLRKVCHAFRDYIDCVKPDSNLKSIEMYVLQDMIFGLLSSPSQSTEDIKFSYKKYNELCKGLWGPRYAIFKNNLFDLYIDDSLWPALKHQKSLLDELRVLTFTDLDKNRQPTPQTDGRFVAQNFEMLFDSLINALESRNRLLQVKSLIISVQGGDQLIQLLRHVDLKILKSLEVYRRLETESSFYYDEDNNEFVLDLDLLKDCKNLEKLHVVRFAVCSPFRMFTHIPDLKVHMQTIYCEDVLRFIQTTENSKINASSEIRFGEFPYKFRFMEAIGLADDGSKPVHVFPSKLSLTYHPDLKCMDFSWEHSS
ncbi:hypothetical protein GCK72_007627 [Caenorhabditis remanei]|uniref:F-box domain-containing protein n=1 Tax=Caenorhabditis remanei TaxID=31234 RepID=A0A6A5HIH5_CAERE|nr:hypothetical protein GCK72_007627 [Caenorhabditis remanei]KAF1767668.1 hypothetical protein GCK72_007627 [Caenorhabditis remanei]